MIQTNYTEKANEDTLQHGPLSRYRLTHWLIDQLKTLFSDPVNIPDERLSWLLEAHMADNENFIRVGMPYTNNPKKACNTPLVLVSAAGSSYPLEGINNGLPFNSAAINASLMYRRTVAKSVDAQITVLTESCDGTLLLSDIIEDYLLKNKLHFVRDGMVHQLNVIGASEVRQLSANEGVNAKDIYQTVIQLRVFGGVSWTTDTQGPVYRGTTNVIDVE